MQRAMQRIIIFLLSLVLAFVQGAAITAHHGGGFRAGKHVVKRSAPAVHEKRATNGAAAEFATQFPSTTDLHLFSSTIPGLANSPLLIISNTTHALFSLNVTDSLVLSMGYVALGLGGTTMSSTHQMIVAIPSSDSQFSSQGGWAISNRAATGHTTPQAISASVAPPAAAIGSLSQASAGVLTFMVPFTRSADPGKQGLNMVYAYSSSAVTAPNGNADNAAISQHDDGTFGSFLVDLSKPVTVNSDGSLSGGSAASGTGGGMTKYQKVIMWHAIVGAATWMIVAPTAVLIGRLGRSWGSWLKAHRAIQAGLTVTLTLLAVILAVTAIKTDGGGFTAGGHQILGFLILIGVIIQASLGQYAHAKLDRNRTKRPGRNVTHIFLGVTLLIAGWVQVYLGLKLYQQVVPGGLPSSNNLFVVWAVFLVLPAVLYAMSCLFLVVDRRRKEGMSWSMAAFGLGRDGGAIAPSSRILDSEKAWPPYVTDLSDSKDEKGFLGRMFFRRQNSSREELDGKISPFKANNLDAFGNPVVLQRSGSQSSKDEGHRSWGNNGASELDAFNQQALQRGFALAVDAQYEPAPIAAQYTTGYGYAQSTNYVADPNAARSQAGGMRELSLRPTLTNDPTAGYRSAASPPTRSYHVSTSPQDRGSRVLYGGPSAYSGGHPTHRLGQESVSGRSDTSNGSSGSRRALVQPQNNAYGGYYQPGQPF